PQSKTLPRQGVFMVPMHVKKPSRLSVNRPNVREVLDCACPSGAFLSEVPARSSSLRLWTSLAPRAKAAEGQPQSKTLPRQGVFMVPLRVKKPSKLSVSRPNVREVLDCACPSGAFLSEVPARSSSLRLRTSLAPRAKAAEGQPQSKTLPREGVFMVPMLVKKPSRLSVNRPNVREVLDCACPSGA